MVKVKRNKKLVAQCAIVINKSGKISLLPLLLFYNY